MKNGITATQAGMLLAVGFGVFTGCAINPPKAVSKEALAKEQAADANGPTERDGVVIEERDVIRF